MGAKFAQFFWMHIPKRFSLRARVYREFQWAEFDAAEMREAWLYCEHLHPFVHRAVSDIARTGNKRDALRLVRARVPEDFFMRGVIRGAPPEGISHYSTISELNWRSVDDVLAMVEASVPAAYSSALRDVDAAVVIASWKALLPFGYVKAAVDAGINPVAAAESGVPIEYLV